MGFLDKFFGPPTKDKFARMMLDAIRKAGEKAPVRYDAEHFRLYREGEGKNELNLTNAYHEYCAAPAEKRPVIFKNLVRTWFSHRKEIPEEFDDARQDVLLGVRNRAVYEIARLTVGREDGPKFDWPYRVLAESLGVGLVYDLPESMMQVQQHTLDQWKTTFDEAFEVALGNLGQISRHGLERAAPGVWVSPWRDNYDPSRMLLLDFIRHHKVAGDPVVMVPNRDTLLLAGSGDEGALGRLVAMAEEAYEQPRSITGMAYRLTGDGEWVPFLPGGSHPHHQKFKLLQVKTIGGGYGDQADALNALHEKTGKDIFVASFSALQKKETGEVRSYCVWSEGVVSFLPRTDDIFFFRPRGSEEGDVVATAPWGRAQAVLGDMMKPVGLYPERYLVEAFPSDEQLAALRPEGAAGQP
jgi:hypothetical protein